MEEAAVLGEKGIRCSALPEATRAASIVGTRAQDGRVCRAMDKRLHRHLSPKNPWIDEAVSAQSGEFRLDRLSPRVFRALQGASENVCQIACDRGLGRIKPPPDGVFHGRWFNSWSRA